MHLYDEPAAVRCPGCGRWWKPGNVSCAVLHLGRGCCHAGDTEVPAPEGGGSGPVSLNVTVGGDAVMTEKDIAALAERIARTLGGEGGPRVA